MVKDKIFSCLFFLCSFVAFSLPRYQIQTEHFTFIFEKDNQQWAQELASYADEVYDSIAQILQNEPQPIKVVIHSDIDVANGSFYPVPLHLNLYVTSPRDFFLGARTENWLRSLFTHELTHYLSLCYESGWLFEMSKFFGPLLKPAASVFQPGWIIEGVTTYMETRLSSGGRGRNPYFEMLYRAQILDGQIPSLKQAAYNPYVQPYGRIYVQGYMMINYLFHRYGDDVMARFYRQMGINPFAPYKAIEEVTGSHAEALYREMIQFYSQKYSSLTTIEEKPTLPKSWGVDYGRPVPTQKGLLSYQPSSPKNPSRFIFLNPNNGEESPIAFASLTGNNDYDALFDGSRILFSGYETNFAVEGASHYCSDLFELHTQTKKIKRITKNKHLFQPAYLGDNRGVAVKLHGPYSSLVEVDLLTGEVKSLFHYPESNIYHPRVSPDKKTVAFAFNRKGEQSIVLFDLNTKEAKKFSLEDDSCLYYPTFYRNGDLCFVADGSGSLELFEIGKDETSKAVRVMQDRVGVLNGVQYGGRIYYQSYHSGGYTIKEGIKEAEGVWKALRWENFKEDDEKLEVEKLSDEGGESVKRYFDCAQFVGWTPFPLYYSMVEGMEAPLGLGFLLYAQSVVKNDSLFFMMSFPFNVFQPSIYLNGLFEISILDFSYTLIHGYNSILDSAKNTFFHQETEQSLSVSLPLYSRSIGSQLWYSKVDFGITHSFVMESSQPFHLFGMGNATSIAKSHNLSFQQGVHFQHAWNSGFRGYPSLAQSVYAGFSSSVLVPLKSNIKPIYLGVAALKATIPLGGAHSLISEWAFSSSNTTNQPHQLLLKGFSYEETGYTMALGGTFGYQFPIAVVDAPLFATLALHSFSGAIYTQMYGNFNNKIDKSAFGRYISVGGELNIQIGFAQGVFPVKIGVACRFPTNPNESFQWQQDIKPYFSVDINSLISQRREIQQELQPPQPQLIRSP